MTSLHLAPSVAGLAWLLVVASAAPALAASAAPGPAKAAAAKPPAKPKPLTGYAKDVLWEVNAQNLTCDEINRLRFLQTTRAERNPGLAAGMRDIMADPQHFRDSPGDVFGSILIAWSQTAEMPSLAMPSNPDANRPGELKMLGYLDLAARDRNCGGG